MQAQFLANTTFGCNTGAHAARRGPLQTFRRNLMAAWLRLVRQRVGPPATVLPYL
jgi:hypothetical protein